MGEDWPFRAALNTALPTLLLSPFGEKAQITAAKQFNHAPGSVVLCAALQRRLATVSSTSYARLNEASTREVRTLPDLVSATAGNSGFDELRDERRECGSTPEPNSLFKHLPMKSC
jgi:hypothetical protein